MLQTEKVFGSTTVPNPKVSIVIPTFKRPSLLVEAVKSAANQVTFHDYEIIIVDNDNEGNNDSEYIKELKSLNSEKISYYRNTKNVGMIGNWNVCLEIARGEWVCLLHDDDLLSPNFLNYIVPYLSLDYNYIQAKHIVFRELKDINPNNQVRTPIKVRKYFTFDLLIEGISAPIGALIRRSSIDQIGKYDEKFYPSSDIEYAIRHSIYKEILFVNSPLVYYRVFVNETFKLETVLGFIKKDFEIRSHYFALKKFPLKSIFSSYLYSRIWDYFLRYKPFVPQLSQNTIAHSNLPFSYYNSFRFKFINKSVIIIYKLVRKLCRIFRLY